MTKLGSRHRYCLETPVAQPVVQTAVATSTLSKMLRDARQASVFRSIVDASWRSVAIDFDDRVGEGLRGLLKQVVPDPAGDQPVRVCAREHLGVRARIRMWSAVGIAFERNRRHANDGRPCKPCSISSYWASPLARPSRHR